MVKAILFGNTEIDIDPRAAAMGGSWQSHTPTGQPMAYDPGLVRFFYNQIRTVKDPVIVDVGASTGSFSLLPSIHGRTVLAFEPNPDAFDVLKSNIAINGLQDDVTAHCVALSDYAGTGNLRIASDQTHAGLATMGVSRYTDTKWVNHWVDVRTLDSYNLPRVDFLKIDVEGAELMVLRGAEETIMRSGPAILIEYQGLNTAQCGYEVGEIKELLQEWGYQTFRRVGHEDMWCTMEPVPERLKVALCSPICGPPTWDYHDSIINWQTHQPASGRGVDFMVIRPQRSAPVAMARNTLAQKFLETDCDLMWLVDDDAKFLPATLDRLMSWNADVVGALCMMRKKTMVLPSMMRGKQDGSNKYFIPAADAYQFIGQHYDYESNEPQILDVPPPGSLYWVDFTGCHSMLIRREVIESIEPPWFDGRLGLEDKYFCLQANAHGFGVYVDLSVLAGHTVERCVGAFDFMAGWWFKTNLEEEWHGKRREGDSEGNGSESGARETAVLSGAERSGVG